MNGEELRAIRKSLRLSQKEMGRMLEAGLQSVSEWERDIRPVEPRAARLAIAYASGYRPPDWPGEATPPAPEG